MKKAYPITLTRDGGFYVVYVPDFDMGTQGESIAEAMEMARDVIGMVGCFKQDEGQAIPEPSDLGTIEAEEGAMLLLVDVDFTEYRKKHYNPTELKQARKAKGLTQKELAEVTGINLRTLQHYEQGSKDLNLAAAITVYAIADALGVKIEDLLDLTRK